MNIEDHIPQEQELSFGDILRPLIEDNQYWHASQTATDAFLNFMSTYANDPMIYGLLNFASVIEITDSESMATVFDSRARCMRIPHRVAHCFDSVQDIACLLLTERARVGAGRFFHTYALNHGYDPKNRMHARIMQVGMNAWSIATARCYVGSILPEKLFAAINTPWASMLHGLDPKETSDQLKAIGFKHTAEYFPSLYQCPGQEMYHAMLNRVSPSHGVTPGFESLFEAMMRDVKANPPKKNDDDSGSDYEEIGIVPSEAEGEDQALFVLDPYEDTRTQGNLEATSNARWGASKFGRMRAVPIVDLEADSSIDKYLADWFQLNTSGFQNIAHQIGGSFNKKPVTELAFNINRDALLEIADDPDMPPIGELTPPEHPTARDLAALFQGYPPTLWESHASPRSEQQSSAYAFYFDVSGSMERWLPLVRSIKSGLGVFLDSNHQYGFSTQVAELPEASVIITDGGTRIKACTQHARTYRARHLVIITDLIDFEDVDMEGIEHIIIIVATTEHGDAPKYIDPETTVFRNGAKTNTKVDIYPVSYRDIVRPTQVGGRSHF